MPATIRILAVLGLVCPSTGLAQTDTSWVAASQQIQPDAAISDWLSVAGRVRILTKGAWLTLDHPRLDSLGVLHGTERILKGPKRLWGVVELPVEAKELRDVEVPLERVEILQVPAGTRALTGALIGAAAGSAVGVVVGKAFSNFWGDGVNRVPAAVAFYGASGALVGALKGSESKKWRTLFERVSSTDTPSAYLIPA